MKSLLHYALLLSSFLVWIPSSIGATQGEQTQPNQVENQNKRKRKRIAARRRAARLTMFRGTIIAGVSGALFFMGKSHFNQDASEKFLGEGRECSNKGHAAAERAKGNCKNKHTLQTIENTRVVHKRTGWFDILFGFDLEPDSSHILEGLPEEHITYTDNEVAQGHIDTSTYYHGRAAKYREAAYLKLAKKHSKTEGGYQVISLIGFWGGIITFLKGGYDYYFADEE